MKNSDELSRITRDQLQRLAALRPRTTNAENAQCEVVARVFLESLAREVTDDEHGLRSLEAFGRMLTDNYHQPVVRRALLDEAGRLRSADHNPALVARLLQTVFVARFRYQVEPEPKKPKALYESPALDLLSDLKRNVKELGFYKYGQSPVNLDRATRDLLDRLVERDSEESCKEAQ